MKINTELSLNEVKEVELGILEWFDKFCKDNHLSYALDSGTLLGAVRHGGFIPWDDDIDVIMLREDYNKFCNLIRDNQDKRYKAIFPEINNDYLYPFGKIIDTFTSVRGLVRDYGVSMGVWIDVFPLDNDTEDANLRIKRYKKIVRMSNTLYYVTAIEHKGKGIKRLVNTFMSYFIKIFGKRFFTNRILKHATSMNQKKCIYVNKCVAFYKPQKSIKRESIANTTELMFEGKKYPVPIDYDLYLTNMYGEYMKLPPVEQRVPLHNFTAFWIKGDIIE